MDLKPLIEAGLAGGVAQGVFSSLVQALPDPTPQSSARYVFFYRFAHALGTNWSQYKAAGRASTDTTAPKS